MKNTRLRDSVTPSGVSFTVRSLKGKDQSTLTSVNQTGDQADSSAINKMLSDCLIGIGNKSESEVTPKFVSGLLSNDRKFILITLRQHTLAYKKLFEFKYDWPLESGSRDKDVQEYSVNFTSENFPIVPYWWVAEEIEKMKEENPDYVYPDGHEILYPIAFENYTDMIEEHQTVQGSFDDGTPYRWKMLDGHMEKNMASLKKVDVNTPIEQRSPKVVWESVADKEEGKGKDPVWTIYNVAEADVIDLEHLRGEIDKMEGSVDTGLTIQHQSNPLKQVKVDLIQIPAFFFPSLGR